jgi:hypothetical protein
MLLTFCLLIFFNNKYPNKPVRIKLKFTKNFNYINSKIVLS